ncbi:hypothetical protein [Helicobacter sp.]|uniref:hypothetical protein n=1 Tax=Helicobacter sp. TaxID=218 RepID=UPI00388DD608
MGFIDCHEHQAARNDKREKMRKVDLCFLTTPKDSRIFDEFCALREKAQGSYLEW